MHVKILAVLLFAILVCCKAKHTDAELEFWQPFFESCGEDLDVPYVFDLENRILSGTNLMELYPDEVGSLVLCVMTRARFMDCDGKMYLENYMNFYKKDHDVRRLYSAVCRCNRFRGEPEDKAYAFFKCIHWEKKFNL